LDDSADSDDSDGSDGSDNPDDSDDSDDSDVFDFGIVRPAQPARPPPKEGMEAHWRDESLGWTRISPKEGMGGWIAMARDI
jgi:hypothetical protein